MNQKVGTPVERILEVASDLFYTQGYRATGINEIIKKSGVAKATFYSHFPTKDDLCKVYLQGMREGEQAFVDEKINGEKTVLNKFLAPLTSLDEWATMTNFRGCAFLNMASEIPDNNSPLRKEGTMLYDHIRQRINGQAKALIDSDPKKYGHLDVDSLTDDYMVLFSGTVALVEIYHDMWPVKKSIKTMRRMIGE